MHLRGRKRRSGQKGRRAWMRRVVSLHLRKNGKREREAGYLAFEASGTELVITRRAKMTRSYSRRVATRAIFRGKFYRDTITLISFNSAGSMDFSPREGGRGRKIDEN